MRSFLICHKQNWKKESLLGWHLQNNVWYQLWIKHDFKRKGDLDHINKLWPSYWVIKKNYMFIVTNMPQNWKVRMSDEPKNSFFWTSLKRARRAFPPRYQGDGKALTWWVITVGHFTDKFSMHHSREKVTSEALKKIEKENTSQLIYKNYILKCNF